MQKSILNITLRVFEKNDRETMHTFLSSLFDIDFQKEKITFSDQKVVDIDHKEWYIVQLNFSKQRHIKIVWEDIWGKLSHDDKKTLLDQMESRVDPEGHFFMRFERKSLLEGKWMLTDGGDCFHFTINVAAYPKSRENALKVIKELLESQS